MKRGWKGALAGAGALVAAFALLRVVTDWRARHTLATYVETHRDAVAAERAKRRATRLPARHGPPSAVRCSDAQAGLLREKLYGNEPPGYPAVVDGWPATRVTPRARSWVQTHAWQLDDLRATLDCVQTLEDAERESTHATLRLASATRDVIVDGMVHAEDGDVGGAVERELDAIRLAEQGDLAVAPKLVAEAAVALSRVIASKPSAGVLDQVERALDDLAPFVPASTDLPEDMKRLLVDTARDADPDPIGKLEAPRYEGVQGLQRVRMRLAVLLLSKRTIVASAVTEIDAQLDRAIDALRSGNAARAREVEDALQNENDHTANPIVWLTAVPTVVYFGRRTVGGTCAIALARATLAIERARDASGHYGSPALPDDPCAHGTPLRFELLSGGTGYRVWSVGQNGKDEGGRHQVSYDDDHEDDLVAVR